MLENGTVVDPNKPDTRTDEEKKLDSIKQSIRAIEGLYHAINDSGFKVKWHDAILNGMNFLNQIHSQLVSELPQSEIEKIKNEHPKGMVS